MPTAVPGRGGQRLPTDPIFDPAGKAYPTTAYTLRKTQGPVIAPETMGPVDAMLVIHEHPFDKLDQLGRALLIQILFTVRSDRRLREQLNSNLLFRWFVALGRRRSWSTGAICIWRIATASWSRPRSPWQRI